MRSRALCVRDRGLPHTGRSSGPTIAGGKRSLWPLRGSRPLRSSRELVDQCATRVDGSHAAPVPRLSPSPWPSFSLSEVAVVWRAALVLRVHLAVPAVCSVHSSAPCWGSCSMTTPNCGTAGSDTVYTKICCRWCAAPSEHYRPELDRVSSYSVLLVSLWSGLAVVKHTQDIIEPAMGGTEVRATQVRAQKRPCTGRARRCRRGHRRCHRSGDESRRLPSRDLPWAGRVGQALVRGSSSTSSS